MNQASPIPAEPPPHLTVPELEELLQHRRELGALLRKLLTLAGLTDSKIIGETLANIQDHPLRSGVPYHPAVVQAWFNGTLVPPDAVIESIEALVADKNCPQALENLDTLSDLATFDPRQSATAYSRLLMKWLGTDITAFGRECAAYKQTNDPLSPGQKTANSFAQCLRGASGARLKTPDIELIGNLLRDQYHLPETFISLIKQTYHQLSQAMQSIPPVTELSVAINAYSLRHPYSNNNVAQLLNIPHSMLSHWRSGKNKPSFDKLRSMDGIFSNDGPLTPPLTLLYQFNRRASAEELWTKAAMNHDFGGMLQACREAAGLSCTEMGKQLALTIGREDSFKHPTIPAWESNDKLPSRKIFYTTDIITAYMQTLSGHDKDQQPEIEENFGPWWTPQREDSLRQALRSSLHAAQEKSALNRIFPQGRPPGHELIHGL